ncbi:hypothetical protein GWI33_017061 [Rhynchophorus ferrugineus]|uniref:Uncharacterized protein n=1 Tax=Rhynchophorus ferrugineus TaxID=354439 RepID=A0A834I0M5_RHYFE|nr:hypothetical protein GWI33_017061 [Rhynchophorus ferrugineus]
MTSRLSAAVAEETEILTSHFGAQGLSLTEDDEGLAQAAAAAAQASTSGGTGRGKNRNRKSGTSGSLSDSSSSVKRQVRKP